MFTAVALDKKEKCCRRCFAYVPAGARKCKYCKYVFKSPGRYIFDKIVRAFAVKQAYPANGIPPSQSEQIYFTDAEIDEMFEPKNVRVLMYLILSDYNYLDEASLMELGETLTSMDKI